VPARIVVLGSFGGLQQDRLERVVLATDRFYRAPAPPLVTGGPML
jgi:hypothetical protein